jgi:hypothetical protein
MNRYTQVVILCEDLQQEVFARTYLVERGIPSARIRTVPLPQEGAGISFVRMQFPQEVISYRKLAKKKNLALVVMIDADEHSVEDRYAEFDRLLREQGLSLRVPDERIGIFIPRRNIETWIYYLEQGSVNEITVYPHLRQHEGDCKPNVRQFARDHHKPLPDNAPTSLKRACEELPRIITE